MRVHQVTNCYPMMTSEELAELVEDVHQRGLLYPVTVQGDTLLDGRNRMEACKRAGVPLRTTEYTGDDPAGFIIATNKRRNLDPSQRSMVAAKIANILHGGDRKSEAIKGTDGPLIRQDTAAQVMGVSVRSVKRAKAVLDHGTPELVEAVEHARINVAQASAVAKLPAPAQAAIVRKVEAGMRPQEARRQVKAETIRAVEARAPSGRFRVLYADPPWSYGNTQPDYHPEQRDHYPVMSMGALRDLPVREWAMDDAVLFLWVTSPILPEALEIAKAWGFAYKASFVWDKVKHNMGHYNSVRHELLFVCVRGSCQPDVRKLFDSVVTVERTEHSRKPAVFRDIITTLYASGPYLELFARERIEGWAAYGNQSYSFDHGPRGNDDSANRVAGDLPAPDRSPDDFSITI